MRITLAEQYRRIKRSILLNAFHDGIEGLKNGNLVMVTSSLPGEGKTFSSFNLAMSVANEFNHSVLYVDADVAKQTITDCLGFSEKAGLTDYLVNENLGLPDLIVGTDIANLKILPAGGQHDRITELWASTKMQSLLSEISQRYSDRLIIFDAPPVLNDSSASILSRIVGQVILVIEAEKTPQHVLEETLNIIRDSQYIGLILNKSNQKQSSDYGYYAHV
jgi:protein-tyrosine kinase